MTAAGFPSRPFTVNKATVVQLIIARLQHDLELYERAARAAHAEATHEQSKAENKYDTRGLEASYLARGQSRQVAELEQALAQFTALAARGVAPSDTADLGALVQLESCGRHPERSWYFLSSKAGGTGVTLGEHEIMVITPQSPLGQQLRGRKRGDQVRLETGRTKSDYRVVDVS